MGIGVAVGEADSSGDTDGLGDADSSGSAFVKYGELLAEVYQSGAVSSFFNAFPSGSTTPKLASVIGFFAREDNHAAIRRKNRSGVLSRVIIR